MNIEQPSSFCKEEIEKYRNNERIDYYYYDQKRKAFCLCLPIHSNSCVHSFLYNLYIYIYRQ